MKERYKIFHRNMKKATQFMESEEGTAVYGPNEFSDMSGNEGQLQLFLTDHVRSTREGNVFRGVCPICLQGAGGFVLC